MTRSSRLAASTSILAVAMLACHHSSSSRLQGADLDGVVGDTAAFGPRILRVDRALQRATYSLAAPAYVLILSVAPGHSIDPVWADPNSAPSMVRAETRTARLLVPGAASPLGATNGASNEQLPAAVQADIDRCVRQEIDAAERRAAAAERSRRPPTQAPARDSAGRPIQQPPQPDRNPAPVLDAGFERRAEAACGRRYGNRPGATAPDTRERYLVLLASNAPIGAVELAARLDGLTVNAENVRGTIEAVAEGLYFDRRAIWSGYYVRW